MNSYVDLGGSEALSLKGALLVYEGMSRSFVTWHEVRIDGNHGAPYLGEAQEVTTAFVNHLAQGLGTALPTEILPGHLLVRSADIMAWWTPATMRSMFFGAHDPAAQRLSGQRFAQPPLLWKVNGRELFVRALQKGRRPIAATPLMIAPYWNVDGDTGCVCQGSMRSPDDMSVDAIGQWEKAFFQSEFTHHTGSRRLTKHPGGFLGLWGLMADRKQRFPVKYLVGANETLEEFVLRK